MKFYNKNTINFKNKTKNFQMTSKLQSKLKRIKK